MNVVISSRSEEPIYEQIKSQIRSAIVRGDVEENYQLPSIRSLAQDLKISVITTKRAYEDLEEEGYIATIAGRGSFVRRIEVARVIDEQLGIVQNHMKSSIRIADALGMTKEQTVKLYIDVLNGKRGWE